jgi:hypothetical protein
MLMNQRFELGVKMQNTQIKLLNILATAGLTTMMVFTAAAEDKIIKKEAITFGKCLNVIATSENKLSIAPKITNVSSQKLTALFTLADGTLTITCDGVEGNVTVSTNTN